eukprot:SAG31_NODE_1580_length_7835_cov_4.074457_7_plen_365_part_00
MLQLYSTVRYMRPVCSAAVPRHAFFFFLKKKGGQQYVEQFSSVPYSIGIHVTSLDTSQVIYMHGSRRCAMRARVASLQLLYLCTMAQMFQAQAIDGEQMDANFEHQLWVQWAGFAGQLGEFTWESAATLRVEVPELVQAYFETHLAMDTRILCFDPVCTGAGDDWWPGVVTHVVGPDMYVLYDGTGAEDEEPVVIGVDQWEVDSTAGQPGVGDAVACYFPLHLGGDGWETGGVTRVEEHVFYVKYGDDVEEYADPVPITGGSWQLCSVGYRVLSCTGTSCRCSKQSDWNIFHNSNHLTCRTVEVLDQFRAVHIACKLPIIRPPTTIDGVITTVVSESVCFASEANCFKCWLNLKIVSTRVYTNK